MSVWRGVAWARVLQSVVLAALAMLAAGAWSADEVTPSGAAATTESADIAAASSEEILSYDDEEAKLLETFPVRLDSMAQVVQNAYNWTGREDASLSCEIGFTPSAVILRGEFRDMHPFHQTMARPAMADWWRITYGADGLEFQFDDPTSSALQVRLALNFGSRAVNPRVELLRSPLSNRTGFLPSASLKLFTPADAASDAEKMSRIGFRAVVPMADLSSPRLFSGPLKMTVKMHDMDGGPGTYLQMQQVIEKKVQ